jgi:cytochrome d ubiquinol oxidase subunit I
MTCAAFLVHAAQQVVGELGGGPAPDALEARRMQALSLAVHIPIVCFGIAFPAMFLFVHGLYLRTGRPHYKALAKRWSKVALTIFAIGVITGTILSFEFGLLWPDFMATFGDVFGLAFGLEGVSFFLEAIFIAIYVYGWDRLPARTHFLTGIPVVLAGLAGSFNVIAVNGWMNHPGGFTVADGKVTDPAPWTALFNNHLPHELAHMYFAGYMVAGFIVAGVYATAWLKGRRDAYHRTGLVVALSFGALASLCQGPVGDWAGRTVAQNQPVKLAAFEGVPHTESGAPFTILGYYDADAQDVKYGIPIPNLLSLLAFHDPNATVQGLDSVPEADRPPVNVTRYGFQTMVGLGSAVGLVALVFLFSWWRRRRLPEHKLFYWAVMASGPASLAALIGGWISTEVGRQPWIVYETMRTSDAVTRADNLEIAFAVLVLIYVLVGAALAWLLRRLTSTPPETELTPR